MALKKVNVNHIFHLTAPNTTRATYDFNPMDYIPVDTETIEKLVFEVRVASDPTNILYFPQFYFNPGGSGGGNYEYPKNHPDNDGYISGDVLYWPTHDNASIGVAYDPRLWAADGSFAITHIPTSNTHYLTNNIVVTGAMDKFGDDTTGEAWLELVSVTIHYDGFGLSWDNRIDRYYETGIDNGVWCEGTIYGRPWPGLISVQEQVGVTTEPVYYGGQAIHHITNLGDYQATVKSFARPDGSFYDFHLFEGNVQIRPGVYFGGQAPRLFNFSWRSWVGNPVEGAEAAYKIHILYNVIAIPERTISSTETDQPNPRILSWKIRSTPALTDGYAPTSKIVVDSRYTDPSVLSSVETLVWDYAYFTEPNQILAFG